MRELTILHLAANRWWTGSADPIIRLVQGLEARGHRVLLAAVRGDRFEAKARESGIDFVPGLSLEPGLFPGAFAKDLLRIRRLIVSEGIQIIHCHHSHDHWLGMLARRDAAVVRTFHNLRTVRHGWPERLLYLRTDGAFAVSRQIQSRLLQEGFAPDRVWPLPGISDLGRFSSDLDGREIRQELGIGAAPVVGSVGRLAPDRGHELLIAGFRILLRELPEARLVLVGKGELLPQLERRVSELGLGGRVLFTGYRDRDLPRVVAAMDCFALMGAGSDESCRAALEAMAAAKPVVARRAGALPEIVVEDETGLLVSDDRPESVAAAILTVLADPQAARRMGAAGRRRVETEFTAERAVSIVESAYRSVLDRRRSDHRLRP